MRKNRFILAAILLLGIGFAAVSTTLYLTGNVTIATNDADFDVKFTKAVIDGTDTPSAIIEGGKKITFGTKDLITVGNTSKLDFEVTNNSEMYDAEVEVNCTGGEKENIYYKITKEVTSPIKGKTTEKGYVQVELLKALVDNYSEPFTCTLTATAKERTTKAEPAPLPVKYTPKYFEFGNPTIASTQDYTTLTYPSDWGMEGKHPKVFLGLDVDEIQKSLCIVRNDSLECFKNNNVEYEQKHIREVFSDITCTSDSSDVNCYASDFDCSVYSDGSVFCYASDGGVRCTLLDDDSISWY